MSEQAYASPRSTFASGGACCASQSGLEPDTVRRLRKDIIAAILSTDMSQHFGVTQEFRKHPLIVSVRLPSRPPLLPLPLSHTIPACSEEHFRTAPAPSQPQLSPSPKP